VPGQFTGGLVRAGPTRLTPVAPDALELRGVNGAARRVGVLSAMDSRGSRAPVNFSVRRHFTTSIQ